MKGGTGTRYRLGQTKSVGDEESPAPELTNVIETADLVNGRASLDYELKNGDFTQHRHEILTRRGAIPGAAAPAVAGDVAALRPWVSRSSERGRSSRRRPAASSAGERRTRRSSCSAATSSPLRSPPPTRCPRPSRRRTKSSTAGCSSSGRRKRRDGEEIGVYFDPQSKQIAAFEVVDTETILGDVPAQYLFEDYKAVDGITLPHHVTIRKGGKDYSDVRYAAITLNDAQALSVFAIPGSASPEADRAVAAGEYTPLALTKVADGLYFARAYSHNSLVVEFPSYIAVVEAPYTETQSKVLARLIREQFPNKPIQYAAVTHHHYDHIGGVRGIAAEGATLLVASRHEPAIRELMDARHTRPPDELEKRRLQGVMWKGEFYEGKHILAEGNQSLELYVVEGSPHAEPIVLAYVQERSRAVSKRSVVPRHRGRRQPGGQAPAGAVRKLNLRVDTNVGGHGGVAPFSELVEAVGKMP